MRYVDIDAIEHKGVKNKQCMLRTVYDIVAGVIKTELPRSSKKWPAMGLQADRRIL